MNHVIVSNVAPNTAPQFPGQHYINTATGQHYLANGVATAANWVLQGAGGGGGSGVPSGAIILSESPTPPDGFETATETSLYFGGVKETAPGSGTFSNYIAKAFTPDSSIAVTNQPLEADTTVGTTTSRRGGDFVSSGTVAYVSTGVLGGDAYEAIRRIDFATGVGTNLPLPYPTPPQLAELTSCLALLGNFLLARFNNQPDPNVLWVYDTVAGTWSTSAAPIVAFDQNVVMRAAGPLVHVFAGTAANGKSHQTYNPATNTWANLTANLPAGLTTGNGGRFRGALAYDANSDLLYVLSRSSVGTSQRFFSYNVGSATWAQLSAPAGQNNGHFNARATIFNGKFYVAQPQSAGGPVPGLQVYTIAADTWADEAVPADTVLGERFSATTFTASLTLPYPPLANGLRFYRAV